MSSLRQGVLERVRSGQLDVATAMVALGLDDTAADLLLYAPVWRRLEAVAPVGQAAAAGGLVVMDETTGGPALLPDERRPATVFATATGRHRVGPGRYALDGADEDAWAWLWQELASEGGSPHRIVRLSPEREGPEQALARLLPLLRAVVRARALGEVRLACVVPGAQAAGTVAALAAAIEVAASEDRRIRGLAVHVATLPSSFADPVSVGFAELAGPRPPGSAEVRHDVDGRWSRALEEVALPAGVEPATGEGGTYVVSGGLGGVASHLVGALAVRARSIFLLLGRSEPPRDRLEAVRALVEPHGGRVRYLPCDVTDLRQTEQALERGRTEFGPFDGVLHAAGVNADAYVVNKAAGDLPRVLDPKLAGARNLDTATRSDPLSWFVLCSSTSAYLPGVGQVDYAAANRALGHVAAQRAAGVRAGERRGTTVAVAWPLWHDGGMDLEPEAKAAVEQLQGVVPLPAAAGVRVLDVALARGEPELLALHGHAERLRAFVHEHMEAGTPVTAAGGPARPVPGTVVASGAAASPAARQAAERFLLDLVTRTAKLAPGALQLDQELSTIGVDSILVRRLTDRLSDHVGPLPVTLLFEHRTVRELARWLAETYPAWVGSLAEPGPAEPSAGTSVTTVATGPAATAGRGTDGTGTSTEPIAIVGIAGRYPAAGDLEAFWELLASGRDAITPVPPDRWPAAAAGADVPAFGAFLDDVARFDALLFGIAPSEAERLEPTERIFLETAWAALEVAGYSRRLLHARTSDGGSHAVGVFAAVTGSQYRLVGAERWARGERVLPHSADYSVANRVSYVLDVHGPSVTVDTGCSGSLTALHLACESLRRGECRMAIAGGVNVNLHPMKYAVLHDLGMLSADGRCRAFGSGGDGFVPGEGAGALVLKPLVDALRDGDHVRAVVLGTAVNHGGKTNGYTVPAPQAQAAVIVEALRRAGVDPATIGYVEAHGTGTALGDPIEIEGLCRAFGREPRSAPCAIGSVKSNIGHLEAAAGVAGVTKAVLQLQHGTLVPTLHCEELNPSIDFTATPFRPQRELAAWETAGGPRRAAVSSFGAGGANAHVVLEEHVARAGVAPAGDAPGDCLVLLSARTDGALRRAAARLAHWLDRHWTPPGQSGWTLGDVAATLMLGREQLACRLATIVADPGVLACRLREFAAEQPAEGVLTGRARASQGGQEQPDELRRLLATQAWQPLAERWVAGADLPWEEAVGTRIRHVPLPHYPFEGARHWLPEAAGAAPSSGSPPVTAAPAVGTSAAGVASAFASPAVAPGQEEVAFLRTAWQVQPLAAAAAPSGPALVLTTSADRGLGRAVVAAHGAGRAVDLDGLPGDDLELLLDERGPGGALPVLYFLGGIESQRYGAGDLEALRRSEEVGVQALLPLLRALAGRANEPRALVVVTSDVQAVDDGVAAHHPFGAGLLGLAKAAARELGHVGVTLVDVSGEDLDRCSSDDDWGTVVDAICREPASVPARAVALRAGLRLVQVLQPAVVPPAGELPLRRGGRYLVVGGAGGVGSVVCRYLGAAFGARLTLVGRRPATALPAGLLDELVGLGAEVCYEQADLTDPDRMRQVVEGARARWGGIDGAIHAAFVLADRPLARTDLDAFERSNAAKTRGSVVLHRVLEHEPLDFLGMFSSAVSHVANAGQAAYAAASLFQDGLATHLATRYALPVKLFNWGMWGDSGAVASAPYRRWLEREGLQPLSDADGLEAFRRVLAAPIRQATVVKGRWALPIGVDVDAAVAHTPEGAGGVRLLLAARAAAREALRDRAVAPEGTVVAVAERYARGLIIDAFVAAGALVPGERIGMEALRGRLAVAPSQHQLLEALLGGLARAGLVRWDAGDVELPELRGRTLEGEELRAQLCAHGAYGTALEALLRDSAAALPAVLAGRRTGVEVLFGGATARVASLYRDDPRSRYFNALCARVAAACASARAAVGQTLDLLEVGAGTGGTTREVLDALEPHAANLRYRCTDVAPALVEEARRELAHPYVDFGVLDIERPSEDRRYDVVVASNVLHATRDLRATLRNLAGLVRASGVVLVNETTQPLDALTLLFGPTKGWWRFEDPELRIPGSPLVAPARWRALLAEAGFRAVRTFGTTGEGAEERVQHLFVAEHGPWRALGMPPGAAAPAAVPRDPATVEPAAQRAGPAADGGEGASAPDQDMAGLVAAVFARVLKVDEDIDVHAPLSSYGADSLARLQAAEQLGTQVGTAAPPELLEGRTCVEIAASLAASAAPASVAPAVAAPAAAEVLVVASATAAAPRSCTPNDGQGHPGEPLAIVGLAGRYPGARDLASFWALLRSGDRAIREVPCDRWAFGDGAGPYHRWGGFLDDVDRFDPLLFGIAPRDAERMDPQERLFLETAWEALEDSGHTRADLERRSRQAVGAGAGVFVGVMYSPYQMLALEAWGRGRTPHVNSGYWSVANRVSHTFGFGGPSLAVDTSCSSSLVALHLACESLRSGECGAAVVGGVNLILHPFHHAGLCEQQMASRDGHSRAFSADASGFVTGEGVGAVVLRPLRDALRDGDRVYAAIAGSFLNAGGTDDGYLTPSVEAQAELVEQALRRAGVGAEAVDYVEAQATGSPLADRVELEALQVVLERAGSQAEWRIGSLKPNIGHLEAAAGLAQLTKVILQLRHGEFVPTVDCNRPVPVLGAAPLRLVRSVEPWPAPDGRQRRAAISAFGAGGANAHVIVEEVAAPVPADGGGTTAHAVLLSARRPQQLVEHARRWCAYLEGPGAALPLAAVACSSQLGREPQRHRLAVVTPDVPTLVGRLRAYAERGPEVDGVLHGVARPEAVSGPEVAPATAGERDLMPLASAWVAGATVDWTPLHRRRTVVSLPSYPFARERYWLDDLRPGRALAGAGEPPHEPRTRAESEPAPQPQGEHLGAAPVWPRLLAVLADVAGVTPQQVDRDEAMSALGLDSLRMMQLAERLEDEFGVRATPTMLYAYRRLRDLADALPEEDGHEQPLAAESAGATVARPASPPSPRRDAGDLATVAAPPPDGGAAGEGVAVVGLACAFAGSPDSGAFWANVVAGRDLVTEIPPERFDWREIYGDPRRESDRIACRWGGFLAEAERFDAAFFRISPREAAVMDPQHRLFLQAAWHAVEDAGHDPRALAGTPVGVFVGVGASEYAQLLLEAAVEADGQVATGNTHSVLANRVSFLLDLRGPSEPVNTACSSSLVAVHRAVRALRTGECAAAIAGGVNLTLTPEAFLAFGKSGMLAADGRCKTFDGRADGYVRGEGVGAVLLKPLSRAEADGDHVYAVLRGTAVNHGGHATSLTAPNPEAQAAVIAAALADAHVPASSVTYVETHGTGTALGDPVEFDGLVAALGGAGATRPRCALGSVKTNIGHAETAAGIAGFIKTVLALHHRVIPPTLHVERVNPLIDMARTPFFLPATAMPWDAGCVPRRAGVSSFGFGGVNAHVVLEEYQPARCRPPEAGPPYLFVLSACTHERLRAYAEALRSHLHRALVSADRERLHPADVAFTLRHGRPALPVRLATLADDLEEFCRRLDSYLDGDGTGVWLGSEDAAATTVPEPTAEGAGYLAEVLRRGDLEALARLWVRGARVDWSELPAAGHHRVPLPGYPFGPERHWVPQTDGRRPAAQDGVPAAPVPEPEPAASVPEPEPAAERAPAPERALAPAPARETGTSLRSYLAEVIADMLGMAAGDLAGGRDLATYGVDSIVALRIMQRVQAAYGDHIPMALIFEYTTLDRLAGHLAETYVDDGTMPAPSGQAPDGSPPAAAAAGRPVEPQASPAPPLVLDTVPFTTGGGGVPVYCLPGDTGDLTWLLHLVDVLGDGGDVIGLDAARCVDALTVGADAVARLSDACAEAIMAHAPSGSCRLAGSGRSGLVALETARRLVDAGWEVHALLLMGTPEPEPVGTPVEAPACAVASVVDLAAQVWGADARIDLAALTGCRDDEQLRSVARACLHEHATVPMPADRFDHWLRRAVGYRRWLAEATATYEPRPVAGVSRTLVVQRGAPRGEGAEPARDRWERWIAPPPLVVEVDAAQVGLFGPAAAAAIARALAPPPPVADRPAGRRLQGFLVPINRNGTGTTSFWIHHLYGEVSYAIYLSQHLGLEFPVFGIEQVNLRDDVALFDDIREMCARYVGLIRACQPEGPYLLGGCSFGAVAAFEVVRQLLEQGAEVGRLCLIDGILPGTDAWTGVDWSVMTEEQANSLPMMILGNACCQRWGVTELVDIDQIAGRDVDSQLDIIAAHVVERSPARLDPREIRRDIQRKNDVLWANNDLLMAYEPQPLPESIPTDLFRAMNGFIGSDNPNNLPAVRRSDDLTNGFGAYVGERLRVHPLDIDHFATIHEANLRLIAHELRSMFRAMAPVTATKDR